MYSPFMSQAEMDAQDRDDARFCADPDAGRHHPECLCSRCDPEDAGPLASDEDETLYPAWMTEAPDGSNPERDRFGYEARQRDLDAGMPF